MAHQHPLQAAQIVPLSLPISQLLEADSMVPPNQLLAYIYSLGWMFFKLFYYMLCEKKSDQGERHSNK